MERFKAAHVTASKGLKKRKGFQNKVRNLLTAKLSKNELIARGKLEASGLGVVPVDLSSWKVNPKGLKKNKLVEVQFITDVTSKLLQSAEAVTLRDEKSYNDAVLVNLPPENASEAAIVEVKNDSLIQCNSVRQSKNEKTPVEAQDISSSLQLLAGDICETSQNESGKLDGDSTSKASGKKSKKREEKKRKSKIIECNESELEASGNLTPQCEENNADDNVLTLEQSMNEETHVEVQDSSSFQLLVSDIYETSQNESEKLNVKKSKKRKEKKRKSKIDGCSASELVADNVTSHCEENNEINSNNNVLNVSAVTQNASVSDSAVFISRPVHNVNTEVCVPSFDMQPHHTDTCDVEPLIVRSEGLSAMKNLIVKRLESVGRTEKEDRTYAAKLTQNMKEILWSHGQKYDDSHGGDMHAESSVTSNSDGTTCIGKVPHTFVREKLESLSIEESNDCSVSVLRDIFHSHSKAQSMVFTDVDACDTNRPQIDIHCLENDKFLLILRNGNPVYIRGKLTVSVFVGSVEILGCKLNADNGLEKYTVFSPRGVSLLSMTTCASGNTFASSDVLYSICAHSQLPDDFIDSLGESDCLLLLEKTENNVVDYLSLHLPNKLFPDLSGVKVKKKYSFAEKKLECEFLSENCEENVKLVCKRDDWDSLSDAILSQNGINETNCTVICGGKGVGKSTLLRFLINMSLSSHEKILCLDFDLGQAEFTVPGCISAVIIKKPLLGPNFTHLQQPERMVFIGDVNVTNCVTQYLEGAELIIDYCKSQAEFQHIPWFVNTMGFCKGLGVEIMMNLLHMVSPTHVIQLQSRSNKRNFPKHLEAEYVRNYKNSLKYLSYINRNLYYELHLLPSAAESKSEGQEAEWGLDSRTLREIVIMSYLSGMTAPPNFSLTEVVPYVCGFKDLKLCVSHETINPNTVLSVMNGSFVALCICDKGEMLRPSDPNLPCILLHAPVCQCLGFGIIRGVDMEERQLYVISPLPEDEIQKVNCLVMGTVQLPSNVLLREATCGVIGHVPYTVIGPGQPTGRLSQKSSCHLLLSSAVGL